MTHPAIVSQLEAIAGTADFYGQSAKLIGEWAAVNVGLEAVEPILRFMERHPEIVFGTPGPLVHFLEQFHHRGYEEALLASVQRKPTAHTVWMLNRLLNGTSEREVRSTIIFTMMSARRQISTDSATSELLDLFLSKVQD